MDESTCFEVQTKKEKELLSDYKVHVQTEKRKTKENNPQTTLLLWDFPLRPEGSSG